MKTYTFNGRTMKIRQWAEEIGISVSCLQSRYDYGWPASRALTEPVRKKTRQEAAE